MTIVLRLILWLGAFCLIYLEKVSGTGAGLLLILGELAINLEKIKFLKIGENIIHLRELQEDVYASLEAVRSLGKILIEVAAYNASRIGRFAPENLDEILKKTRTKLLKISRDLNLTEKEIKEILSPLDPMIKLDQKIDN